MKTHITLIAVFITCFISAQETDYLSNDPNWRQEWWFGGGMPCLQIHNYIYYLNGDSLIGGLEYKKVFKRGETEYIWLAPPPHQDCEGIILYNDFWTLLRQDGKKLFIYEDGNDHLLYDFNLAVGDTLPVTWNMTTQGIIVSSVDSIFMGDHYRKKFSIHEQSPVADILIEGVGFGSGLLEPFPMLWYPTELLCFTLNDTTYFPGYGEDCDLTVKVPLPANETDLSFYPNPVKNRFRIDHSTDTEIQQVIAYDRTGRRHFMKPLQIGPYSIELDLSGLNQGLYILELYDKKSAFSRIKVMKL